MSSHMRLMEDIVNTVTVCCAKKKKDEFWYTRYVNLKRDFTCICGYELTQDEVEQIRLGNYRGFDMGGDAA